MREFVPVYITTHESEGRTVVGTTVFTTIYLRREDFPHYVRAYPNQDGSGPFKVDGERIMILPEPYILGDPS